jgi:hypothetical protein
MTDRVFEDARSWEVSDRYSTVEVYASDPGEVIITMREDADWDSQYANLTITAEEATMLKEFLIRKGY